VTAPVLFLTARDALTDRLSGFHAGGDDYLTKPFAVAELLVRVAAMARRAPVGGSPASVSPSELVLDPARHAIAGSDGEVSLTPTEFRLLAELAVNRGRVVRRAGLTRAAWPDGAIVSDNTLDAYVSRIRGKLRDSGRSEQIANVRGVGYVLR
jgi:two-component system response regulator MprA